MRQALCKKPRFATLDLRKESRLYGWYLSSRTGGPACAKEGGPFLQGPHIRPPKSASVQALSLSKKKKKKTSSFAPWPKAAPLGIQAMLYAHKPRTSVKFERRFVEERNVSVRMQKNRAGRAKPAPSAPISTSVSIQSFGALFFPKAAHVPRDAPLHQSYALLFSPAAPEKKKLQWFTQSTQTKKVTRFWKARSVCIEGGF